MRCATRAYACDGVDLATGGPGYPTTRAFSAPLSSCAPRTDDCPNPIDGTGSTDTARPTSCNPLAGVKHLAAAIKSLKARPDEQILVAAIFGWPDPGADPTYQIDLIPNPDPSDASHPQIYDVVPTCYDPDHRPTNPGAYDPAAASWGATAGLRIASFIDEFGANGIKLSICDRDFESAMLFSDSMCHFGPSSCIDDRLYDVDGDRPGVQPDCRVVYR